MIKLALSLCLLVLANLALAADSAPKPGDLVRVTVYGQPDLTTVTRVESNGDILFPFVGRVRVGDLSSEQAAANIAQGLEQKGIVRNAQVTVLVSEEGLQHEELVTVLGEVSRPGRYPLPDQSADVALGLVDVLAMAGGATADAGSTVTVFRRSGGNEERIEVDINSLMDGQSLSNAGMALTEGDVVIVPKGQVFYVYGQVQHPGRYPLTPDLLVMQAISISGGVTERGSERDVTVTRKSGEGHAAKDIKLDDVLEPGDVVYVKERFF